MDKEQQIEILARAAGRAEQRAEDIAKIEALRASADWWPDRALDRALDALRDGDQT